MIRAPFQFPAALHYFPMKMTHRIFAFSLLIASLLFSVAVGSAATPAANHKYLVFVGTYTTKTESKGIYAYEFDSDAGKLAPKGVAAETPDPSWVAVHPSGKFLYAANEAGKSSTVSAFAIDAKSGRLTLLNQLPALGEDPCYLSFDKTGKYVFVANYTSGNIVVFPIGADGKLGTATANVHDEGKLGPNQERQEASHAHWIEVESTGGMGSFVYVADLGLDRVLTYQFHSAKGELSGPTVFSTYSNRKFDPSAKLSPGTGPRHGVFSTAGERMYVLGELNSTVTVFHMMGTDDFVPTAFQQISALPDGFNGRNDAAEIALHPSGNFLYTSNRGSDTVAVFNVERRGGRLKLSANVPTGGKEPRHFAIDPSGNYLLAENQLSNNIVVFKIDPAKGGLTPTGQVVEVPSPVNIAFLPED
jgi:6-phosphogluconolactonase